MQRCLIACALIFTLMTTSARSHSLQDAGRQMPGDTTYRLILLPDSSFGYNIYVGGKMLVHQPGIPGQPGNKGFVNRLQAEKVAKLVILKLHRGLMPPTVEKRELDSLKIKF